MIIGIGCFLVSCSVLNVDRYFNDRRDMERIFNSRYTERWLANAYCQLLSYNLEIGHVRFTLTNYSDDMSLPRRVLSPSPTSSSIMEPV